MLPLAPQRCYVNKERPNSQRLLGRGFAAHLLNELPREHLSSVGSSFSQWIT